MLGDIALGDAQKLDTMTRAYSKMQTKGKATMEELNMVTEAGVPILQALADSQGVSVAKIFEMSSKGQIAFKDVQKAMKSLTSETGQFNKGMEKLSETTAGKFSTALDNLTITAAEFGTILLPLANEMLESITELAKSFGDLDDGTKKSIIKFAALVAGIGPAITAVTALGKAFELLASPAGGIGLALIAVTAIIAGIKKINEANLLESEKNFDNLADSTGKTAKELNAINLEFANLVFQGESLAKTEKIVQEQFGLTNNELVAILAISKDLYDTDLAYYKELDERINGTNTRRKETVKVIGENVDSTEDLIDSTNKLTKAQLDAYVAQNEAVQEIINANKPRL